MRNPQDGGWDRFSLIGDHKSCRILTRIETNWKTNRNELKTIASKTHVFEEKWSTILKPKMDINKESYIIGQILKERTIVMNE